MRTLALALALVFSLASGAGATPVITNGLVAAYEFSGNADDASGNGNDGVVNGATLTADRFGNLDSAYSFDAVDDNIRIGETLSGLSDYTQSAWVNLGLADGAHAEHAILTTPSGTLFYQHDPRVLNIVLIEDRQGGITGNPHTSFVYYVPLGISDETWFHVAVTAHADNTAELFINGIEVDPGARTTDGGGVGDIPVAMIGAGERSNKTPPVVFQFSGSIDDVYIYDRALSSSEIQTLYSAIPEPTTGLLLGLGLLGVAVRRRV
jgi:hypothetical protein